MAKHLTVDSFLADVTIPFWMKQKMDEVRQILLTFPEISERIRYTVPFYDYHGMLIYLGPFQKKRLMVGFCNGHQFNKRSQWLIADAGQTHIRHFELFENKTIPDHRLLTLVQEAINVNKTLYQMKHGI